MADSSKEFEECLENVLCILEGKGFEKKIEERAEESDKAAVISGSLRYVNGRYLIFQNIDKVDVNQDESLGDLQTLIKYSFLHESFMNLIIAR